MEAEEQKTRKLPSALHCLSGNFQGSTCSSLPEVRSVRRKNGKNWTITWVDQETSFKFLLGSSLRVSQQLCWSRKSLSLHLVPNLRCHRLLARSNYSNVLTLCRALSRLFCLLSTVQQSNCEVDNLELNSDGVQHRSRHRSCHRCWNAALLPASINH